MRKGLIVAAIAAVCALSTGALAQYHHRYHHYYTTYRTYHTHYYMHRRHHGYAYGYSAPVVVETWRRDPDMWRERVDPDEWAAFTTWRRHRHHHGDWHSDFHVWINLHPRW